MWLQWCCFMCGCGVLCVMVNRLRVEIDKALVFQKFYPCFNAWIRFKLCLWIFNVGRILSLQFYDYAFVYVEGSKHVCGCFSLMLKFDSLCVRLSTWLSNFVVISVLHACEFGSFKRFSSEHGSMLCVSSLPC